MMSTLRIRRHAVVVLGLVAWAAPQALQGQDATQSSTASVLRSLRTLKLGTIETHYFLAKQKDETVGYAVVSLQAAQRGVSLVYKYKNETSVPMGEKSRVTLIANATLQTDFQPIDIKVGGTAATPAGTRIAPKLEVTIDRENNEITTIMPPPIMAAGEEITPQVTPRPDGQFVYGLDALMHVLDLTKHKNFKIPEFIPQTGAIHDLAFVVEGQVDGSMIVKTTRFDGADDYQFWFDTSGELDRWGEPPFDLLLHRATKEEVANLKVKYAGEFKPLPTPKPNGG